MPRRYGRVPQIEAQRIQPVATALTAAKGQRVTIAGQVLSLHRPPTKSGRTVVFLCLEDETGMIDVTVFERIYQQYGATLFTQPLLVIAGQVDRRGGATQQPSLTANSIQRL